MGGGGGTGVRRGKEEGRCGQTAKIGCYVRDGKRAGAFAVQLLLDKRGKVDGRNGEGVRLL